MNETILRPNAPPPRVLRPPAPGPLAAGGSEHVGPEGEKEGRLALYLKWAPVRVASLLQGHDDDADLLGWSDGEPLAGWEDDAPLVGVLLNVNVRSGSPSVLLLGHDDDLPLHGWIDGVPLDGS